MFQIGNVSDMLVCNIHGHYKRKSQLNIQRKSNY